MAKKQQTDKQTKEMENKNEEMNSQVEEQDMVAEGSVGESPTQGETTEKGEADELEMLKSELGEAKDKYLRLFSEFENFRRRTAKERLELIGTANEDLMRSLLPIMDDFERADKAFDEKGEIKSFKEGYDLIFNKLKNITESKGLKAMETKQGDDFSDEVHEAITQIPAPEDKLKGKIVDIVEKGYFLGEKVIRFAKVVTGA